LKIPEKPPDWSKSLEQAITPEMPNKVMDLVKKANSDYLYWDRLKYQPMPEGIGPEIVWAQQLSRRMQMKPIPLTDANGQHFGYWLPDCAHRDVHFIDQQASGSILVDDPSVHSAEKKRYVIRSLVEEAISSSQIEGAVTTRIVAKEMLRTGRRPQDRSEQMIYNNYLSMMIKNI
jgi:hypothetical protein